MPRIPNPAMTIPGLMDALQAASAAAARAAREAGVPKSTIDLIHIRASQINGCAVCLDMHTRSAKGSGQSDERLFTVAGWRDAPYFDDAERAALALTEAASRLADREAAVPDDVWQDASAQYSDAALAAIVAEISVINLWNRLNVATAQVAGPWTAQFAA